MRFILLSALEILLLPGGYPQRYFPLLSVSLVDAIIISCKNQSTGCAPYGWLCGGNPVSCNGKSCAAGPGQRFSKTGVGPSPVGSPYGTGPPAPGGSYSTFYYTWPMSWSDAVVSATICTRGTPPPRPLQSLRHDIFLWDRQNSH